MSYMYPGIGIPKASKGKDRFGCPSRSLSPPLCPNHPQIHLLENLSCTLLSSMFFNYLPLERVVLGPLPVEKSMLVVE
jgi:hypothetical protein